MGNNESAWNRDSSCWLAGWLSEVEDNDGSGGCSRGLSRKTVKGLL